MLEGLLKLWGPRARIIKELLKFWRPRPQFQKNLKNVGGLAPEL